MQFSTNCPACGAVIPLTSDSQHVSCPYCSRDFDVDLSEASPSLRPGAGKPKEYIPPLEPVEVPEPVAEVVQPDVISPVEQSAPPAVSEPRPSYAQFEPATEPAAKAKKVTERLGKWLWVLIILLVLLCVTCVGGTAILVNWAIQQVR
jgi:hypothetical protein